MALNLEWGNIRIFKNRFREEDLRPDLDTIDFEILHGADIYKKGDWYNSKIGKVKGDRYKDFMKEV